MESKAVKPEALKKVFTKRFGKHAVLYDHADIGSNKEAVAAGRQVVQATVAAVEADLAKPKQATTQTDEFTIEEIVELTLPSVPVELKQQPRWLTWSGDVNNKQPYISGTTDPASTNKPEHLVTFEAAALNLKKRQGYLHLGFVPIPPYFGLDLDSCRDPQTGEVKPWATELLKLIGSTYTEITPSLSGLRPWVKLDFQPQQKKYFIEKSLGAVEKAPNVQLLTANYGTITGEPYLNAPSTVAVVTEQQWALIEKHLRSLAPEQETRTSSGSGRPYVQAINAKDGDTSGLLAGLPDVQERTIPGNGTNENKLRLPGWSVPNNARDHQ